MPSIEGLRNTQRLGDYVLAHAYVREDHVLDHELPLWVPIPALAEVQVALEEAVALDPSLAQLADLPIGWRARRPSAIGGWTREPHCGAI